MPPDASEARRADAAGAERPEAQDLLVPMSARGRGPALVCFPPAGAGSGFFGTWRSRVPPRVNLWAVRLPGRESLYGRPGFADLETAADHVAVAVRDTVTAPVVLVGHCLGAHIAYEVALRLQHTLPVRWLAVAGTGPPDGTAEPSAPATDVASASDAELLAELARTGRLPAADGELARILLPALRADLLMADRYLHAVRGRRTCADSLRTPVVALVRGAGDPVPVDLMRGWARLASGGFALHDAPDDDLAAGLLAFLDIRSPGWRDTKG